jgi:virulence-associated protein VapD
MNFIEDIEEAVEDVRYYEQEDDADIQRIEDEQVFEDY